MKRLHTGVIVFDIIDILCLSFSAGSLIAYGLKRYRNYGIIKITDEDIIVTELKRKSPINVFSEKGKPLKLPVLRGGDEVRALSIMIKSKKLARIMMVIINARKNQRRLRLLQDVLFIFNGLLTNKLGLRFAAGGSLSYVQIILIAFPSTIGGFMMGTISAYPLMTAVLPIAILLRQGIEDIPDPYEKCKFICKTAQDYHNQQLMLEMKNLDSLVAPKLVPQVNQISLLCTEEPLSLVERYKLKEVIKSAKARNRVQHFSEFIKKFPECDADPRAVYEEVIGNGRKI
jgi:hypothetical protein